MTDHSELPAVQQPVRPLPIDLDRFANAMLGQMTFGLSPVSLAQAYTDWMVHLASSPAKQMELAQRAFSQTHRLALQMLEFKSEPGIPCIEPLPQDNRFRHPSWRQPPFSFIYQSFLLTQQWWHKGTSTVRGVSRHHRDMVTFTARQLLDMASPSNFLLTNPEVLEETWRQGGSNLVRGARNWWEDWAGMASGGRRDDHAPFQVGRDVAVSPGRVVYRNHLIELIQYAPTTAEVHAEPVLIVSSWIMKYYVLDLSPGNSLVKYLVGHGHTVFMISWRNPDEHDRNLGMEDYLQSGPLAALEAVAGIVPEHQIHGVGYCLGGTLMSIAAAALARDKVDRLATLTLLAAETDFEEPGELGLFIDESQLTYLENIMWEQGYLDGKQMAGTFQLLRSRDLVWSRMVHEYLMGQPQPMSDLQAWNADTTRLPYRMHSEYLRRLYLNNQLAHGQYCAAGKPVALTNIRVPMFVVATIGDHVSPWHSMFKIHLLTDTDVTFVLTTGGHNVGIVNPPSQGLGGYQIMERKAGDNYLDSDAWQQSAPRFDGSWWPAWEDWLARQSTMSVPARVPPLDDTTLPALPAAPGGYVFQT